MKIINLLRIIYLFSLLVLMMSCSASAKIKKARDKAIDYLNVAEISYDHVYLYSHLQQKFNLRDLEFEKKFTNYEYVLKNSEDEISINKLRNIYLYRRLFDKNHKIQKIDIEQAIDLNYLILSALYCNDFQIDSLKYFQLLKEKSDEGEYALTHSLLALYLLNENACYNFKVLENLKSELISKNLKMLEEHKYEWNDINIESSALLQEVGYKFSKKHIREILKQQQDDGGWKADNNSTQSNAHTTVLALWSISVYLNRLKKS